MVNAVVPLKQRMETAYEYARKLAESAPLVLGLLETFTREMLLPRGPSEMSASPAVICCAWRDPKTRKKAGSRSSKSASRALRAASKKPPRCSTATGVSIVWMQDARTLAANSFQVPGDNARKRYRSDPMRVVVDHNLCEGNGRCAEVAPQMFELRDDDRSYVLIAESAAGSARQDSARDHAMSAPGHPPDRGLTGAMAALTLETLDIVNPDLYVQRGYPHEEWALLRKEAPVFRYERPGVEPFWAITKHADVVNVSRQPDLFRSSQLLFVTQDEPGSPLPDEAVLRQLLNMNPPEHGEFRRVVNQRFTPRSVQQLKEQIERITTEVLDEPGGARGMRLRDRGLGQASAGGDRRDVRHSARRLGDDVPAEQRDDRSGGSGIRRQRRRSRRISNARGWNFSSTSTSSAKTGAKTRATTSRARSPTARPSASRSRRSSYCPISPC